MIWLDLNDVKCNELSLRWTTSIVVKVHCISRPLSYLIDYSRHAYALSLWWRHWVINVRFFFFKFSFPFLDWALPAGNGDRRGWRHARGAEEEIFEARARRLGRVRAGLRQFGQRRPVHGGQKHQPITLGSRYVEHLASSAVFGKDQQDQCEFGVSSATFPHFPFYPHLVL